VTTYIILCGYTQAGLKTINESPERLERARKIGDRYNVEIKQFYLTMGQFDLVLVIDAPSDDAVAKFCLSVSSLGALKMTTLRAFDEREYREVIRDLIIDSGFGTERE
jgi:uncharacterized protein with GYD domain